MKIIAGSKAYSTDFWYDINEGYLKPEELLELQDEADKVKSAISILKEFEKSLEEQIEDFVQ